MQPSISPAQCGGLIEAARRQAPLAPRLRISPAQCGGLIEALPLANVVGATFEISPAQCGGLIEADSAAANSNPGLAGISPAQCGGLIEASQHGSCSPKASRFPPRNAGASLKHGKHVAIEDISDDFPRAMRGPH